MTIMSQLGQAIFDISRKRDIQRSYDPRNKGSVVTADNTQVLELVIMEIAGGLNKVKSRIPGVGFIHV